MATDTETNGTAGGTTAGLVSDLDNPISPTNKTALVSSLPLNKSNGLESLNERADPDAQTTVTDYLDFTEYLPADVNRSLTLIGKLDQTYIDASALVHELTSTWGKLPTLPADQRPAPVQLRADISDTLNQAVNSRISSHAEAKRMAEYVNRHVNRAKTILVKLQHMRDNYPTEEQRSPVQTRSPQLTRTPKLAPRLDKDGNKIRGPPRITVPGEVLAPYEIDFTYSSSSESSSEEEASPSPRNTPAPRIKLVKGPKLPKQKIPKPPRAARQLLNDGLPIPSTSSALAKLRPPPPDAALGGPDRPWLQLTPWELAKLRKRMKKNAVWNPSETMVARELKQLGRGHEALKAAQKEAEEAGKPFEYAPPVPITDAVSGVQHQPVGALSLEALGDEEVKLSNRGMKLNEAKKLKREQMAKQAVEEAEESARRMKAQAMSFWSTQEGSPSVSGSVAEATTTTTSQPALQPSSQSKNSNKSKVKKRKRDSTSEGNLPEEKTIENTESETPAPTQPAKPQIKRTKTETPIPPPQFTPRPTSVPPAAVTPVPPPQIGQNAATQVASTTPVPIPAPPRSETPAAAEKPAPTPSAGTSPVPPPPPATTTITIVPTKPPAETKTAPPAKTSTTPILPPANSFSKRETRKDAQKNLQPLATNTKQASTSGQNTPVTTPGPDQTSMVLRRPASRGKANSVEPAAPTLAADRPRRTSTARNTPAPEIRQPSKRIKRPAPGVVNKTSGGTSAVGKRTAAPRKKQKTKKGPQAEQEVEVEVDDEGNVIDPDEARYCICNRVSFGTMIQCDNVDNCKQEWFHLECVGLTEIPARTTKWYCPDCRVLLNIGGRGEVTSRGVKL